MENETPQAPTEEQIEQAKKLEQELALAVHVLSQMNLTIQQPVVSLNNEQLTVHLSLNVLQTDQLGKIFFNMLMAKQAQVRADQQSRLVTPSGSKVTL